MPLAPRLASTPTPSLGAAYHSRSRIGMDEDTTRSLPSGIAAMRSRPIAGSVGSR